MADDEVLNDSAGSELLPNDWWSDDDTAGEAGQDPARQRSAVDDGTVVNYVFPVEVVLVGSLPARDRETLRAEVWQELQDAVNRRLA